MRVLFLSDLETAGGAGISASRLANGLATEGVEVLRFFGIRSAHHPSEPVTWQSQYAGLPRPTEVVINGLRRLAPELGVTIARGLSANILLDAVAATDFDVLHVHAIHNSYWRHDTLARLPAGLPTVWTFHDSWGFSPESHRFQTLDGAEVRLKPDGLDRAAAQMRRQKYFASRERLRLVANSHAAATYAHSLLGASVAVIPCGLPLDLYQPVDQATARQALKLPPDALVLGFSADSGSDPVKGYAVLEAALRKVRQPNVWAIAMGSLSSGDRSLGNVTVRQLGRVDNPRLQSIVYSAADAFVMPSLAEGLGQVAMESIACGTPVIGSNVGGIPDVVVPGVSGWLVPPRDVDALVQRVELLVGQRNNAHGLASTSRSLAESRWGLRGRAQDYLRIYRELVPTPYAT